jgi:hypothetical protein
MLEEVYTKKDSPSPGMPPPEVTFLTLPVVARKAFHAMLCCPPRHNHSTHSLSHLSHPPPCRALLSMRLNHRSVSS